MPTFQKLFHSILIGTLATLVVVSNPTVAQAPTEESWTALEEEIRLKKKPSDEQIARIGARLEELADQLKDSPSDQERVAELYSTWAKKLKRYRPKEADPMFRAALAVAQALEDSSLRASLMHSYGKHLLDLSKWDQALKVLGEAREIYRGVSDDVQAAQVMLSEGVVLGHQGKVALELRKYSEAEAVFLRVENHSGLGSAALNRGATLMEFSRYDEALDAFARAEESFGKTKDERSLVKVRLNRGVVLDRLSRSNEALEALAEAVDLFRGLGDRYHVALAVATRGGSDFPFEI